MKHPTDLVAVSGIRCRQIRKSDLPAVIDLLAGGFPAKPREHWSRVFVVLDEHHAPLGFPKYGYLLEVGGIVVGAIIEIFTAIQSSEGTTIRCNVSSWFVQPVFRSYASLLVSKALSHQNVTYLNVTPAPHTLPIVEAQGYARYVSGLFVAIPAAQFPVNQARVAAMNADGSPGNRNDFENKILADHAKYGCLSLWCTSEGESYPFVFRPRFYKGIPCAQLVYCRGLDHFVGFSGAIGRFLLMRGRPFVLIDANGSVSGLLGKYFDARMAKYFKGPHRPRLGDLAYTEVAMFGV